MTETVLGAVIPANEVAERLSGSRRTAVSRSRDRPSIPSDPRRPRSGSPATSRRRGRLRAPSRSTGRTRSGGHLSEPPHVRGHEATASSCPGPTRPGTQWAPGWGLDTANPLVAGTDGAAVADVALTTADLMLAGGARGLRAVPPAGPPRRGRWRAVTASSTTPRSRPRRSSGRPGGRSRSSTSTTTTEPHAADLLGAVATCCTSCSTRISIGNTHSQRGRRPAAREERREPQPPAGSGHARTVTHPGGAGRRLEVSPGTPGEIVVVSLGFEVPRTRPRPDRRLRPHDRRVSPRVRPPDRGAGSPVILQEGATTACCSGRTPVRPRGAERRPFEPLPATGFGERLGSLGGRGMGMHFGVITTEGTAKELLDAVLRGHVRLGSHHRFASMTLQRSMRPGRRP